MPGLLLHLPTALQCDDDEDEEGLLVVFPTNIIPADLGLVVVGTAVVVDVDPGEVEDTVVAENDGTYKTQGIFFTH